MSMNDINELIAAMEVRMTESLEKIRGRMQAFEREARRIDKIEEDVATLAGHIGEIKATLAEIAVAQQAQPQQAALLAGRVDATEQAIAAIKVTASAYDERVRQVSASMGELRLTTRAEMSKIIMRPRG